MSDQISGSAPAFSQPIDSQFEELVELAQAGDKGAIASLIKYYEGRIHGYIQKQVGNEEIAKDLYQDVVYKVCKALPGTDEGLRSPAAAKKWFFQIATHCLFDYFKACKQLRTVSLESLEQPSDEGNNRGSKELRMIEQQVLPSAEETVCSIEERRIKQELITEALRGVPGQLRKCFYLKDVENLSHADIAQALNISESAARSYASRGRKAFLAAAAELRAQQGGKI